MRPRIITLAMWVGGCVVQGIVTIGLGLWLLGVIVQHSESPFEPNVALLLGIITVLSPLLEFTAVLAYGIGLDEEDHERSAG